MQGVPTLVFAVYYLNIDLGSRPLQFNPITRQLGFKSTVEVTRVSPLRMLSFLFRKGCSGCCSPAGGSVLEDDMIRATAEESVDTPYLDKACTY